MSIKPERQIENAKVETAKPFDKEDELSNKTKRLAELDNALDMDKADETQICDEKEDIPGKLKEIVMER